MATTEIMLFGMGITFLLGIVFMLWGLQEELPYFKAVYHFFASILFIVLGQLFLMEYSETTAVLVFNFLFVFLFGGINFLFFVVYGVSSLGEFSRTRKYGKEED